jgi:hypothetical protein
VHVGNVRPDRSHSETITRSEYISSSSTHVYRPTAAAAAAAAAEKAKKNTGIGLFQTPPPRKKIGFGCRHIACMLYITHSLRPSRLEYSRKSGMKNKIRRKSACCNLLIIKRLQSLVSKCRFLLYVHGKKNKRTYI